MGGCQTCLNSKKPSRAAPASPWYAGLPAGFGSGRTHLTGCGPVTLTFSMAISKDLLEILVCPLCKAPVELKQDEHGLKCVECKRVYPIRDDIPVMLVDEARIED